MTKDDRPDGFVRPYVLSAGSGARRRDASEHLTSGDQRELDWTGDLNPRGTRDPRPEPPARDAPAMPRAATARPEAKPVGTHRASAGGQRRARRPGWPGPLAERRWLAAVGAGVAALAIVGGTILFLSRPLSMLPASMCRAAGCPQRTGRNFGGAKPPADAPAAAPKAVRRSYPTAHPTARRSAPPSATPTPTLTPTPTASPTQISVKVSYTVVSQHPNSFQGQFTIVNNGSTAISGWELVVDLPGDRIRAVWDASFHTDGDILYVDPPRSQQTIAPGATITENFTAHGSTTTLASCTFNGSAC